MTAEAELFRCVYGRHCRMTAQALHDGYHRHAVYLAYVGKSKTGDRRLQAINRQAGYLDGAIRTAHAAGLTTAIDLVPIASQTKATIESEWDIEIPLDYESPTPSA